jgi:DNA-binding CsgD family transcriptional regulator
MPSSRAQMLHLYGRDAERDRIGELLDAARASQGGALLVRGEPGIGKTALLEDARERAADMHLLEAHGVESESELPFAALHQLLRPALGRLDALPPPQAAALRGALGLSERTGDDRFLVSLAALTLLSEHAAARPVLALVDDAHWLDTPSADALLFVARRLQAEGVALLLAVREDGGRELDAPDVPVLQLQGLDAEAAELLLTRHAGVDVAPRVRDELVLHTGGNALALLELPATLSTDELAGGAPLPAALPLSQRVERVFLERVRRLPEDAQQALRVAAAEDTGDVATVMRAATALGVEAAALDQAEEVGLISIRGGRIDFRHPLVRSAVYQASSSTERRAAHRALAEAIAGGDEDRRVWHRAAAALGPDEEVAAALEAAALEARRRTGFAAAATALERAANLTPDRDARLRRVYAAAEASWLAGRGAHAVALGQHVLPECTEPRLRAHMLHLLGPIEHFSGPSMPAYDLLFDAAGLVEELDPARAADILSDAFEASLFAGEPEAALRASRRARQLAPEDGAPSDYLAELDLAEALFIGGLGEEGVPRFERALELLAAQPEWREDGRLATRGAIALAWLERSAEARRLARAAATAARAQGAVAIVPYALFIVAWAERRTGAWQDAVASGSEGIALARTLGQTTTMAQYFQDVATVAAASGDESACRAYVAEGAAIADGQGARYVAEVLRAQLGLLHLGAGRLEPALGELESSAARFEALGLRTHDLAPFPDLVEVLARLGRLDEARDALRRVHPSSSPRTGEAIVERCRGLVADDDAFEAHLERSLALHPEGEDVFNRARTQLVYGERLRRAGRRADARRLLRPALVAFETLGAAPWAERVRTELRATGEVARSRDPSTLDQLTPQELQVARLVAEGLSNKEVAAQLFLSPRTIDAHLRGVFGKLGLKSRTQLARVALAADGEPPEG